MSNSIEEKRVETAKAFVTSEREAFKKFIPRDTIDSVGVTTCVDKGGAFEITGPVATTSPTGKLKTFRYVADVKVNDDGFCSLAKLQVSDL